MNREGGKGTPKTEAAGRKIDKERGREKESIPTDRTTLKLKPFYRVGGETINFVSRN